MCFMTYLAEPMFIIWINADNTTKENSEQSERIRHWVVKSVFLITELRFIKTAIKKSTFVDLDY